MEFVGLALGLSIVSFTQCICLLCLCHSLNRNDERLEHLEKRCVVCYYKKCHELHHRHIIQTCEDPAPHV